MAVLLLAATLFLDRQFEVKVTKDVAELPPRATRRGSAEWRTGNPACPNRPCNQRRA